MGVGKREQDAGTAPCTGSTPLHEECGPPLWWENHLWPAAPKGEQRSEVASASLHRARWGWRVQLSEHLSSKFGISFHSRNQRRESEDRLSVDLEPISVLLIKILRVLSAHTNALTPGSAESQS